MVAVAFVTVHCIALQKSHDVRITCESKAASNGDVEVVLTANNESTLSRHISVVMCATARYYTGVQAEELDEKKMELDLEPGERTYSCLRVILNVKVEEQYNKLW